MAPDASIHAALAEDAEATYALLTSSTSFRAWKLITLFYQALHRAEERLLAPRDQHARSHVNREFLLNAIQTNEGLTWVAQVRGMLIDMKSKSIFARYEDDPGSWTDQNVREQRDQLERIIEQLEHNA